MPCVVDVATQEILKLAAKADPDGIRTMGVLTKPDLATERVTQDAVLDLIEGRKNPLKLGYCVVKNRSGDDNSSTMADRLAAEQAFFTAPPWSSVVNCCGIAALKDKLRELLMEISKREMPNVKSDIDKRLRERMTQLEAMGESRADESTQRQYLVKIASSMQDITKSALNGFYATEILFKTQPAFKLITRIIMMNEVFANTVWKRGQHKHFGTQFSDDGEGILGDSVDSLPFEVPLNAFAELRDIIMTEEYECPKPLRGPMTALIQEVYESSRGPELGTVSISNAIHFNLLRDISLQS